MSGFTSGPWAAKQLGSRLIIVCRPDRPDEGIVAEIKHGYDAEDMANAYLIAAAPDLLVALEAVVADYQFSAGKRTPDQVYASTHPVMQAAAAIANAREQS